MTTLNLQVGADADDIRCWPLPTTTGAAQTIVAVGVIGGDSYGTAMRFTAVTIPQGDPINSALLIITPDATQASKVVTTDIDAEDVDNADSIDDTVEYRDAVRTTAKVAYDGTKSWTLNGEETLTEMKTVTQELVNRVDWSPGNAMVYFWEDDLGSTDFLRGYQHDDSNAKAPKLAIDFEEGFITGAASLSGIGSVAVAAALTLPAKVAISGIGSMAVLGTLGTIKAGEVALSGVGSMAVAGVIAAGGKASMSGAGSMAAVGRRVRTGVVAMSGVGSLSAIGEVAGALEGRAAISGVGSMSVIGQRIVGGKASFSGVGSVTVAAASILAGKVVLSGVGSMAVIGETGEVLYTVFGGVLRSIDPADYPAGAQFFFEVTLDADSGTARARLYNITDAAAVTDSDLSTASPTPVRLRSSALTLPSAAKTYRVEYGGAADGTYTIYAADVLVESD